MGKLYFIRMRLGVTQTRWPDCSEWSREETGREPHIGENGLLTLMHGITGGGKKGVAGICFS